MGLLKIIRKGKALEREIRILILGLDNAGKTTILKHLNGEDTSLVEPTLGFNIKTLEHNGFRLNIWDVGGQKSIRSFWRNYFENTDALVWVVDSADSMRIDVSKEEIERILSQDVSAAAYTHHTRSKWRTAHCSCLPTSRTFRAPWM